MINNFILVYRENAALCHQGILGQKWGIRRYQNSNGSLTSAGEKRYDDQPTVKQKSNHRIKLEEKYKANGMTDNEASVAADKRIKTEKVIGVVAGLAVAAGGVYLAYKHYDNSVDKLIKSNTLLQNISTNDNRGVSDAFYASKDKLDNIKYKGLYGDALSKGGLLGNSSVYETKIKINDSLKVASKKSATNVLNDLVKTDKTFVKNLESEFTSLSGQMGSPKQNKVISDGLNAIKSNKIDAKTYEALNLALVDHGEAGQKVSKQFYESLKSKGYDAIKDINDSKYSGYKSSNPLIVFNGTSKLSVDSVRKLGREEIEKSFKIGYADIAMKELVKTGAVVSAAVIAGKVALSSANYKMNASKVIKYRSAHPNSQLSYSQILKKVMV